MKLLPSRYYATMYFDRRHRQPKYFVRLLHRFLQTISVNYLKTVQHTTVTFGENQYDLAQSIIENPQTSTRNISGPFF